MTCFPNGVGGALVLVVLGAAIGAGFGAMSNGLALLARRDFNPVNWAVEAGRAAALDDGGWDVAFTRLGLLAAFLLVCSVFATRAFRTYQRSV